jgi:hypothetical protein
MALSRYRGRSPAAITNYSYRDNEKAASKMYIQALFQYFFLIKRGVVSDLGCSWGCRDTNRVEPRDGGRISGGEERVSGIAYDIN